MNIRSAPYLNRPVSEGFLAELKRSGASKELIEDIEKYNRSFSFYPEVKIIQKENTMWDKLKAKLMMAVDWLQYRWFKLKEWVLGLFGKKDEDADK